MEVENLLTEKVSVHSVFVFVENASDCAVFMSAASDAYFAEAKILISLLAN